MDAGVGEAAAAEGAKSAGEATLAGSEIGPATGSVLEAGTQATGAVSSAAPGVGLPAETALAAGVRAELGAANAGAKGPTGSELLQTAKTVAPIVSAGASLVSAAGQAEAAKKTTAGATPAVAPPLPQAAIDPDLTEIRKKNALLFGLDSPSATDITGGKTGVGSVGRATLLGGASSLGN